MTDAKPNKLFTGVAWLIVLFTLGCGGESPPSSDPVNSTDLPSLPAAYTSGEFPRGTPREPIDLRIAFVGEVRGELEPCGCPTLPYGGFTRRAVMLDRLRKKGPLFHLDAGELLLKGIATDRSRDREKRSKTLLELSQKVGVDLWVPGPTDLLALGPEAIASAPGPRRISATWTDPSGKLLLPPTAILERDGLRLGVVGLSAAPTDSALKDKVLSIDPVLATQRALASLPDDLDLVVALSNVADEAALRVATEAPGLAALLTIRKGQYQEPALSEVGTAQAPPVIEVPDRGRYLQLVTVRVGAESSRPALIYPETRKWRDRASSGQEGVFTDLGSGRNLIGISTIPLGRDLDVSDTPLEAVRATLHEFKTDIMAAAASRAQQPPPEIGQRFASSGGCVHCHSAEFARWSLSSHAKAWRALVDRGQTQNPECLPCHTTAWGEPTGLGELTKSGIRKFKGVQCESCHGPMGGHPEDARVGHHTITEAQCIGCHDAANSPDFDYAKYLPQGSCQGGSPEFGVAP